MSLAAPPLTRIRLVPLRARGWVLGVAALLAVVVVALGVRFAGDRAATRLDLRIMVHLYAWYPDRRALAGRIADLGGPVSVVLATAVLAVVCWASGRRRGAVLAVLGPGLATVLTEWVLKPSVDRRMLGYLTYPSGHSTGAFAVATVVGVLLIGTVPRVALAVRLLATAVVAAIACLVAVSLVTAGWHVPTDTVGGAGVGIATVLALAVGIDAVADALGS